MLDDADDVVVVWYNVSTNNNNNGGRQVKMFKKIYVNLPLLCLPCYNSIYRITNVMENDSYTKGRGISKTYRRTT